MQLRPCTRGQNEASIHSTVPGTGGWAHGYRAQTMAPLALSCSPVGARDQDTDVFPISTELGPGAPLPFQPPGFRGPRKLERG